MSFKLLMKSLLVTPAVLGASLLSSAAFAQTAPEASAPSVASLDQVIQYSNDINSNNNLAQVTSVTQFSDVSPSDWAYEALSFLANSQDLGGLDCLEGYPDGSFRGNRAMTRYEFAAGLAACLDAINGGVDAEQLSRIEALQREFAAELAALRGRVDALEASVAELEANQFSTTTRLAGETIFLAADLFGGSEEGVDDANNLFLGDRVRLNLLTSFTGEDLLFTRLQSRDIPGFVGVGGADESRSGGFNGHPYTSDFSTFSMEGDSDSDIRLGTTFYQFPAGPATFTVGVHQTGISDIVTSVSPFDSGGQGSVGWFGYNPIYDLGSQSTALGASFDIGDSGFNLGLGYLTDDASDPSENNALFNGDATTFGQLTYGSDSLTVALTYVNAYLNGGDDADTPLVNESSASVYNAYGLSANYVLNDTINIGGWVTYTDGRVFEGDQADLGNGRYWTYAATLGIQDLGIDGSLLGLIVGVPPYTAVYDYANGGATGNDASLYVEALYRIPVSDNISITPALIYVSDPSSNNDNEDIFIGALRTTFRF